LPVSKEIALRILQGLKSPLRAFIFEEWDISVSEVTNILRSLGLADFFSMKRLPARRIYVLEIRKQPCIVECRYGRCRDDPHCYEVCLMDCINSRTKTIIEKLKKYISEMHE